MCYPRANKVVFLAHIRCENLRKNRKWYLATCLREKTYRSMGPCLGACYGQSHSVSASRADLDRLAHQGGCRDSRYPLNPLGEPPGHAALAAKDQRQVRLRAAHGLRKGNLAALKISNVFG